MNALKQFTFILVGLFLASTVSSQGVSKNTIVEHFTNTRCSVCASRNPGFYAAKKQKPKVMHIAYHPSSPYSNCLFSTQNKVENDARTNYYGLFGGTPAFSINGDIKSSSAVQNVTVYNSYDNQTSPISIDVEIGPSGSDSISVFVEVKAVSSHSLGNLSLYVPLIEDTVFYNAPNGEKEHYDVFRKSFSGANAVNFSAPVPGGNSFFYTAKIKKNQLWNLKRLSAVAIVSSANKIVIQAEQSDLYSDVTSSLENDAWNEKIDFAIFPNPSYNSLNLNVSPTMIGNKFAIYGFGGNVLKAGTITQKEMRIDIGQFPSGLYIMKVDYGKGFISKMFLKN